MIVAVMEIKNLQLYERVDQFVFLAISLNKVRQKQLLKNCDKLLCVNAFKQKMPTTSNRQVTAFTYDNFSRWHNLYVVWMVVFDWPFFAVVRWWRGVTLITMKSALASYIQLSQQNFKNPWRSPKVKRESFTFVYGNKFNNLKHANRKGEDWCELATHFYIRN